MQAWDDNTVSNSEIVDTAAPGRSPLDYVFRRSFKAEQTVLLGVAVLRLFWDLKGGGGVTIALISRLWLTSALLLDFPIDFLACVSRMQIAPRALEHIQ